MQASTGGGLINGFFNANGLLSDAPFGAYPDPNAMVIEPRNYRDDYCFDCASLCEAIIEVGNAQAGINDEIGDYMDDISAGLASWESKEHGTAETFKANYVESITERQSKQHTALDHVGSAMANVAAIVDANRTSLLDVLEQTKKALEEYDAELAVTLNWMDVSLQAAGIVLGPIGNVASMASTVTVQKTKTALAEDTGVSALGIVNAMEAACKELSKTAKNDFQDLASDIETQGGKEDPKDHVLSCPQTIEAHDGK